MLKKYSIKAPAKLNIGLKLTGRRSDGYHELISIMVPISLFDYLDFRLTSNNIKLICNGDYLVPADERNLAYRAAQDFFILAGIHNQGLTIHLTKKIPVEAGLGGGSSDAAATLLALNNIFDHPLTFNELHNTAVRLGADVAFFLERSPCIAKGIGDILEPIRNWPRYWYVIITPKLNISTSWVYQSLNLKLTTCKFSFIIDQLRRGEIDLNALMVNDLEPIVISHFPLIGALKEALLKAGAIGALMSGSGSSVFGIFTSSEQAYEAKDVLLSQQSGVIFVVKCTHYF